MSGNRFEELMGRLLDDELSSDELSELVELTKDDADRQRELQTQLEAAEMLAQSEDDLRQSSLFVAAVESRIGEDPFVRRVRSAVVAGRSESRTGSAFSRSAALLFATTAIVAVVFIASQSLQHPAPEPTIATVTGLSGPLQWTGNGGRVFHELRVGSELPGGTVEGMAPDSWFELEFCDGSTVTISGTSTLTFSDSGQKELYLKMGNLSGNVNPQPSGKPMLVYTTSAMLEVLGTQFGVEAERWSTALNVSEGKVRIKRLSDGSTVDVPAKHRVVAAADRELSPELVPKSIHQWKSSLHLGPDDALGNWSPATEEAEAKLGAVPFSIPEGRTIFAVGLGVSSGDGPPVVLEPGSQIRVRGRLRSQHRVFFGVTVRHSNGDFAGRFQTIRPAEEFQNGQAFDVVLALGDYQLDPSLNHIKDKLPSDPVGLVVESFWCHTLFDSVGLEIMEVELIPPAEAAPQP